jgi:hypothetical protein
VQEEALLIVCVLPLFSSKLMNLRGLLVIISTVVIMLCMLTDMSVDQDKPKDDSKVEGMMNIHAFKFCVSIFLVWLAHDIAFYCVM